MNLFRLVLVALILLSVALLFVRVVVPAVRRLLERSGVPTVVPGEVVPGSQPGTRGLPAARRHGYDRADVDELLDRVYALAVTPSGRTEALELVRSARFHLDRRGGYVPVFVDDAMDAIADALASGRDLPPRPDQR